MEIKNFTDWWKVNECVYGVHVSKEVAQQIWIAAVDLVGNSLIKQLKLD